MCDIKYSEKTVKGGIDVSLTCKTSGKPITVTTDLGMFCEDMCDLQKSKDAKVELDKMLSSMAGMFGMTDDDVGNMLDDMASHRKSEDK